MRYMRVVVPTRLFTEDDSDDTFLTLIVDTEASPSPLAIAKCSDGSQAQTIVNALNA